MKTDLVIARLDTARLALREAKTIQETKKILDAAAAMEIYARRQELGEELIGYATEIKMEALRQIGRMLETSERASNRPGPGRGKAGHSALPALSGTPPTLAELGLNKKTSALAQQIAKLPDEQFEAVKKGVVTISKMVRQQNEADRKFNLKTAQWPKGKYRVIYADPPWQYGDARTGTKNSGGVVAQYETMTLEAICALPVKEFAMPESVLFLWATSPLIPEAIEVIKAWGFQYKASFVWDKVRGFNGHYNDVQHELLLVATRGSCLPESDKLPKSIVREEKSKHSKKPESFRALIDTLYSSGTRLEMFARTKSEGWDVYGNEL
jgi:N6-adenosine-specific RNA methylase IME4